MKRALDWIGHQDFHLALAEILDVVVERAKFQLLALGCSTGQGYFFSKPMAAHETNELLRTMRGSAPITTNPTLEIVRVS